MHNSIWNQPLESFCADLAAPTPAPAAVSAAAVTARFGIALLIKVLEIVQRRRSFTGDRKALVSWIAAAHQQSIVLAEAADADITAPPERKRSEIPNQAGRAAEAGLALCAHARAVVTGAISADLDAAVAFLDCAARAIRRCVESNQARP